VAQSESAARESLAMIATPAARIVILSGNSLSHNPRVLKAAGTLARAGHEVTVLGAWRDADLKAQDQRLLRNARFRFTPVLDITRSGWHGATAALVRRARRKAAHLVHRAIGRESPHQLGDAVALLLQGASAIEADLYIAHSEQGLHAAWRLMRQGRRVGVDMEDWFSEDLLPQARRSRPLKLLRFLEAELLRRGAYASCPSRAMSAALAGACGGRPPFAIYNAFPWADRQAFDGRRCDRHDTALPSVFWYSQTLGPGRGIEDLVAALPLLESRAEVHLRGRAAAGFETYIRSRLPQAWQQRVYLHPLVASDELGSRITEHDVGFAGEQPNCRSRDLTVTNKMLHYLLGGLAVVASDTAGQREVSQQATGAIALYQSGNPRSLADALESFLKAPENLQRAKHAALQAARGTFCWERQEPALLEAVAAALAQRSQSSRCDR
jgi:glycosyltransferase involved in cell wall biosynthesis